MGAQEPAQVKAPDQVQTPARPEVPAQSPDRIQGQAPDQVPSQVPAQVPDQAPPKVQDQVPANVPAQETDQQSSGPSLKLSPLELLRRFEPAADEEYRLGKGDEITVDFTGRPELQAKLVVGPDGNISLPLAGELTLAGLTRTEGAAAIETSLKSFYNNLAVQISVSKYTANRILVLGAVDHPGVYTFDGTPTLLEALARGGVETGPSKTDVPVGANQVPERCAIYRGQDQVVWVELKSLIETGNPLADLRLRRDDVVYVPSNADRFVSVLGEVARPGAVPLTHSSTLATILAGSGGLTEKAGGNPRIQIVDPATGTSRVLKFKDVLDPAKSLEVTLKPGEIIYVPRSGFAGFGYVLEQLNPLVSVAMMGFYTGVL